MHQNHRTFRWMIGSLLVLSLAACQSNPETEEALESSTTATEITIEPSTCRTKRQLMPPTASLRTAKSPTVPLSDWEGEWQSVYPYLLDGTLDSVFAEKAEETGEKTAEEYKEYYTVGYESTFTGLTIAGDSITFYEGDTARTGTYAYSGYQILTYESGKKGVRYLFERTDDTAEYTEVRPVQRPHHRTDRFRALPHLSGR